MCYSAPSRHRLLNLYFEQTYLFILSECPKSIWCVWRSIKNGLIFVLTMFIVRTLSSLQRSTFSYSLFLMRLMISLLRVDDFLVSRVFCTRCALFYYTISLRQGAQILISSPAPIVIKAFLQEFQVKVLSYVQFSLFLLFIVSITH